MPVLKFKKELLAPIEVSLLWDQFELAFKDSLSSSIWPNELEALRSEGLEAGTKVLAEYYGPLGSVKRTYGILEVAPRLFFRYMPLPPHAFRGEARVDFEALSEKSTRLVWSGEYFFKGLPLAYLYFKFFFEKRFFSALQRNLNHLA